MTRRQLLQLPMAAAALRAADVMGAPITKIEAFNAPYKTTAGFRQRERPSVLVKITTEDRSFGWGQSVPLPSRTPETPESVITAIRNYLTPALIGKRPGDFPAIHSAMRQAIGSGFSTGMPIAKAGLDLAIYDLLGKAAGKNIPQLWGLTPTSKINLCWTIDARTMADANHSLEEGLSKGFKHFRVIVGLDPKFDWDLCAHITVQMEHTFILWVDAGGNYDLNTAREMAPRLKVIGVSVFEQPIPTNDFAGLRELKRLGGPPIILSQGIARAGELREFYSMGMLDGIAINPQHTAGLFDAKQQIDLMNVAHMTVLGKGFVETDVALAATLQLCSAFQFAGPAALDGPQFLTNSYLRTPLIVKDAALEVPLGPGLGVTVDEEKVRRLQ